MFLNKYKNKRRLGKGAYGDVYLVEDETGQQLALKLIATKMIEDYLDGEIECMKSMNSPNIIKLYDVNYDESYIYLVLEYCDGGDLINYQAKLKDRVFALSKATEVLSEVIIGLEQLHKEGYLHRDIKSQNVLIKNENGKEVCFPLSSASNWQTSASARKKQRSEAPSSAPNSSCPLKSSPATRRASTGSRSTCGPLVSSSISCSTWNFPSVPLSRLRTQPALGSIAKGGRTQENR